MKVKFSRDKSFVHSVNVILAVVESSRCFYLELLKPFIKGVVCSGRIHNQVVR